MRTQLQQYLADVLAIKPSLELWQPASRLPLFLRNEYRFYKLELLGVACLIMADQTGDRSAANIEKHFRQVREKWDGEVLYARPQISAVDRKRLVDRHIPFLVPGNQMYLPMLGVDFREHFRRVKEQPLTMSPATQAAIVLLLTTETRDVYDAQKLAKRLQYSKMTASRTLNELLATNLEVVKQDGRKRLLDIGQDIGANRKKLWEQALPLINTPVTQTKCVRMGNAALKYPVAGLTALAKCSMLAAPHVSTIAMTNDQWKHVEAEFCFEETRLDDPEATQIQIWSYDPELFAEHGIVDRFSLFLSLKDETDERVEGSLEELMEAVSW